MKPRAPCCVRTDASNVPSAVAAFGDGVGEPWRLARLSVHVPSDGVQCVLLGFLGGRSRWWVLRSRGRRRSDGCLGRFTPQDDAATAAAAEAATVTRARGCVRQLWEHWVAWLLLLLLEPPTVAAAAVRLLHGAWRLRQTRREKSKKPAETAGRCLYGALAARSRRDRGD